jgi:hypothetical protein
MKEGKWKDDIMEHKDLSLKFKKHTRMPVSSTSATLMNGSPFKGSKSVFQLEDPFHFPCTKGGDILCSKYKVMWIYTEDRFRVDLESSN